MYSHMVVRRLGRTLRLPCDPPHWWSQGSWSQGSWSQGYGLKVFCRSISWNVEERSKSMLNIRKKQGIMHLTAVSEEASAVKNY